MFSVMYSHTQVWKSKDQATSNLEANGSGFDVTPAPSSRSSMSMAREYPGNTYKTVTQKELSVRDAANDPACLEDGEHNLIGWPNDNPKARKKPPNSSEKDNNIWQQGSSGRQDSLSG